MRAVPRDVLFELGGSGLALENQNTSELIDVAIGTEEEFHAALMHDMPDVDETWYAGY